RSHHASKRILHFFYALRSSVTMDDQPYARVEGEVADGPVNEGDHPVAEADQRHEVNEHPHPPGKKALESDFTDINHGLIPSDGCHGSLVEIDEPLSGLVVDYTDEVFRQ